MNFSLDENNDLYIEDGEFPIVTELEELRQIATQELLSIQGDWFADFTRGIPLYTSIVSDTATQASVESIYLDYIADIPGIQSIKSFGVSLDSVTRTMSISFKAGTHYGALNFSTVGAV